MSSNPMDREIARLMSEGQAAAKRGDRAMARELLTQLVEKDPHNEQAWLWLSGVVADPHEQQICLENALVINPYNAQALKGLQFVTAKTGTPPRVPIAQQAPDQAKAPTFPEQAAPESAVQEAQEAPTLPAWMDHLPTGDPALQSGPPTAFDGAAPTAPESWAVPGAVPADPFVAAAPYAGPEDPANPNGNTRSSGMGVVSDMAVTVPYTAPEPAATDMPFMGGSAYDMPAPGNEQTGPMNGDWDSSNAGNRNGSGMQLMGEAMNTVGQADLGMNERPIVPPPGDEEYLSTGDPDASFQVMQSGPGDGNMDTNLPTWLEGLTPSDPAPTSAPEASAFTPFDMSNFGSSQNVAPMTGAHDPNMPFGVPDPSQVGPYSAMRLPSPHELPGDMGRAGAAQSQPWYLQSGGGPAAMAPPMPTGGISSYLDSAMLSGSMTGAAVLEDNRGSKAGAMIDCPNCKEQVPETSLACPNCRYNFFVNCPHCHELVDTGDAVPGQVDPCPYCKAPINKMEMGMGGVTDLVSQKNPGSRPADAGANSAAFPAMKQTLSRNPGERRALSFNWVVDLLWLVAIVLMVWALTQLPTWLNLSGLY
jgi:hypothetical protein